MSANYEYLTRKEVARRLTIAVSTLDQMVRAGRFPEPIRYNSRCVRWPLEVVERWQAEQIPQRSTGHRRPA